MRFQLPSVLRLRGFRDLLLGQAISQLGDAFYYVAFMFMVEKVTGSSFMVGLVGALETLPFLIFGPYAGVLADRLDRRKIMLVSDLVCGACLVGFGALILVLGKPPVWALLFAPFLLSSVRCFFMPAKSAAVPRLVPDRELPHANAISMTAQNLMPMMSLAISAAALSQLYHYAPVYFYSCTVLLNAVSFLLSAVYIARLPVLMPDRKESEDASANHVMADLKDGVAYLKTRRDLNILTVMLAVFRLSVAPFFVVYLAANNLWFGGRPETITWLEFSFFVGMVAATAFAARPKVVHPTQWFAFGLAGCGLAVGLMAFTPNFWLFALLNLIAGLAIPFGDVPIITYLQRSVPDAYRGRVNAVRDMIATGVMPIGMVLGGALAKQVGVVGTFIAMGVGMLSCLLCLLDRGFRTIKMPPPQPEKVEEVKDLPAGEPAIVIG